MRATRTLRTALVAAGVTAALGISAAGAFAATADVTYTAHDAEAKRAYVKTVNLADKVSQAKIYKTGKDRYEAEIWAKDVRYGTLYTQGLPTQAQHNGLHITLEPNGTVTSWVDGAKPGPEPVAERTLIGTSTLADGATTAKIYRITGDNHEAEIFANGTRLDLLVANGLTAYGENNGLHVALHPDGQLSSWLDAGPTP